MLSSPQVFPTNACHRPSRKIQNVCSKQYSTPVEKVPLCQFTKSFGDDWVLFPDVPICSIESTDRSDQIRDLETPLAVLSRRSSPATSSRGSAKSRKAGPGGSQLLGHDDARQESSDTLRESGQTGGASPPKRPSPRRLPTPDLDEIDSTKFWTCCEQSGVSETQ
ncbi:hypothetical protein MMC24_006765 [Lignoscripta atroalba]|nr:hypothetical protein [Lignoscripta atroalba]